MEILSICLVAAAALDFAAVELEAPLIMGGSLKTMETFNYASEAELFDYNEEAELFSAKGFNLRRRQLGYKRFARASDAIRFVIEELPPQLLVGAYLQVGEARYASKDIRHLYDNADYPLARSAAVTAA